MGRLFCKEHLRPKPPTLPPFKQKGVVGRIYMEEWRGTGHPCPPYYDYLKAKGKEDLQKQWEALNKMRKLPPVPVSRRPVEIYYEKPKSREIAKYIIGSIVVVLIIWVLLYLFK